MGPRRHHVRPPTLNHDDICAIPIKTFFSIRNQQLCVAHIPWEAYITLPEQRFPKPIPIEDLRPGSGSGCQRANKSNFPLEPQVLHLPCDLNVPNSKCHDSKKPLTRNLIIKSLIGKCKQMLKTVEPPILLMYSDPI